MAEYPERMLRWFRYSHLSPALQSVSRPFAELAEHIVNNIPPGPERTVGLRKLLESKDATVRAHVEAQPSQPKKVTAPCPDTSSKTPT